MKVLLINGSPNKEGCTYTALREAAGALNREGIETEIFWIGRKQIGGCIDCGQCATLKKCVFDGTVNEARSKCREADGIVFGSPVHYAGIAGCMSGFMDRLMHSEANGNGNEAFYLKPGACVVSARRSGTTAAFDQLNKYLTIAQMPVVSSCYWNNVHGANAEEAARDEEGLMVMRVLGRNMAYLLKCIKAGRDAGVPLPEKEKRVYTNFISNT